MKNLILFLLVGYAAAIPQYSGSAGGSGGVGGTGGQNLLDDCGHSDWVCVPTYQCIDGVLNTGGIGLIDARISNKGACRDPTNPSEQAVCCKRASPYKDPVIDCPINQACLEEYQCSGGNINTDGAGLIDPRKPETTCWTDRGSIGVCCNPPLLDDCPLDSICTDRNQCRGQAYDMNNEFQLYSDSPKFPFYSCGLGGRSHVCCIPDCPYGSTCLEDFNCFTEALDSSSPNNWYDVTSNRDWKRCNLPGYSNGGVCCSDAVTCPSNTECVDRIKCVKQAWDRGQTDFYPFEQELRSFATCFYGGQYSGVCCEAPYLVDTCPGSDTGCVPSPDECYGGQLMDLSEVYNPIDYYQNDYSGAGGCLLGRVEDKSRGYCCQPKVDVVDYFPNPTQCGLRNDKDAPTQTYVDAYGVGTIDTRIVKPQKYDAVGTNDTYFGEVPWQAIVFTLDYTYVCAAILISDNVLLTTAHNMYDGKRKKYYTPQELKIRLGEWKVDSFDEPLPYEDYLVDRITIHPKYNSANYHNDIGIIELKQIVSPFQYHVNRVCLPPPIPESVKGLGIAEHEVIPGSRCIISGWGKDNFIKGQFQATLKVIEVPYVKQKLCQELLRKTRLGRFYILDDSFVCAGGEPKADACYGDGGGPLACETAPYSNEYQLVGIVAWGIGCGNVDVPGVYVNVAKFLPWIGSVVGNQKTEPNYGY